MQLCTIVRSGLLVSSPTPLKYVKMETIYWYVEKEGVGCLMIKIWKQELIQAMLADSATETVNSLKINTNTRLQSLHIMQPHLLSVFIPLFK